MIGNELEIEIIELFRERPKRLLSIHQIATKLGKSYPYIYKKVQEFLKLGIFTQNKIANSTLCSINLASEQAILLLSINEFRHKQKFLQKNKQVSSVVDKLKELSVDCNIQTVVFFEKKLHIICDEKITAKLENSIILSKKEFQEKILNSQNHSHTLIYHSEKYYEIIGEIEHELKIRNSVYEESTS